MCSRKQPSKTKRNEKDFHLSKITAQQTTWQLSINYFMKRAILSDFFEAALNNVLCESNVLTAICAACALHSQLAACAERAGAIAAGYTPPFQSAQIKRRQ